MTSQQLKNLAGGLNPAQREAVTTIDGPVLVVAGAGSGKTRTLVHRVAHLVELGIPPESILLLTFTRKAAGEMLNRAVELGGARCTMVSGGTFHALAHEQLRRHAERLGFKPDFTILDRGDMEELLGQLRKEAGLSAKKQGRRSFPQRSTLANIISKASNKVMELGALVAAEYAHLMPFVKDMEDIALKYSLYKTENNQMDLDDLLLNFARLLGQDEEARRLVAGQYQYIMVDEYQDTNPVQAETVRLLGRDHANVMAVGDDAQSIYSFRGASFENIMSFPSLFPATRVIRLEENYRSRQPILELTNHIIAQARRKYDKKLFSRKPGGARPVAVRVDSEAQQSLFVIEQIRRLVDSGVAPGHIAVLFRAARHSFDLEIKLQGSGLDFVKYGGRRFLEKAHIKDLLALLKIVANPRDTVSLARVLTQMEGVGPKTAAAVVGWIDGQRELLADLAIYPGSRRIKNSLAPLGKLMAAIAPQGVGVQARVEAAWAFYQPLMEAKFDDYPERYLDIMEFLAIAKGYTSLRALLGDMTLDPPEASPSRAGAGMNTQRVTLSTIHSAKGLEWHTVFILWATEGRFPAPYAMGSEEELDEERRLMYVAATRAEENLFFICPPDPQDPVYSVFGARLSRFIADAPAHLLDMGPRGQDQQAGEPDPPGPRFIPAAPPPADGFHAGQLVEHRVFGRGRVVGQKGEKIRVDFERVGLKVLHVRYASLAAI